MYLGTCLAVIRNIRHFDLDNPVGRSDGDTIIDGPNVDSTLFALSMLYNGSADVTVHVIVEQTWVKEEENPSANE